MVFQWSMTKLWQIYEGPLNTKQSLTVSFILLSLSWVYLMTRVSLPTDTSLIHCTAVSTKLMSSVGSVHDSTGERIWGSKHYTYLFDLRRHSKYTTFGYFSYNYSFANRKYFSIALNKNGTLTRLPRPLHQIHTSSPSTTPPPHPLHTPPPPPAWRAGPADRSTVACPHSLEMRCSVSYQSPPTWRVVVTTHVSLAALQWHETSCTLCFSRAACSWGMLALHGVESRILV